MTLIKFCGLTREADVDAAVELGVDAVGFVLWPRSPRAVTTAALAALVRRVPPAVTPVGVFVRPSTDEVTAAIDAGIRVMQVHGGPGVVRRRDDCDVWVATSLADEDTLVAAPPDCTLLLDAHDPERHGGTGRTIDWAGAARIASTRRVILAGGLTPANVAEAIRHVRPYGVDVASGIEEAPGVKDAETMRAFVTAVREADQ